MLSGSFFKGTGRIPSGICIRAIGFIRSMCACSTCFGHTVVPTKVLGVGKSMYHLGTGTPRKHHGLNMYEH